MVWPGDRFVSVHMLLYKGDLLVLVLAHDTHIFPQFSPMQKETDNLFYHRIRYSKSLLKKIDQIHYYCNARYEKCCKNMTNIITIKI